MPRGRHRGRGVMTTEGSKKVEVPEKLQKQVRSVLLSSPKGVQLRKFCSEYRSLVKEPFPWKQLGIMYE